jgi:hypothetical protein
MHLRLVAKITLGYSTPLGDAKCTQKLLEDKRISQLKNKHLLMLYALDNGYNNLV